MTIKKRQKKIREIRRIIRDEISQEFPNLTIEHAKLAEMRLWTHLGLEFFEDQMEYSKKVEKERRAINKKKKDAETTG